MHPIVRVSSKWDDVSNRNPLLILTRLLNVGGDSSPSTILDELIWACGSDLVFAWLLVLQSPAENAFRGSTTFEGAQAS